MYVLMSMSWRGSLQTKKSSNDYRGHMYIIIFFFFQTPFVNSHSLGILVVVKHGIKANYNVRSDSVEIQVCIRLTLF